MNASGPVPVVLAVLLVAAVVVVVVLARLTGGARRTALEAAGRAAHAERRAAWLLAAGSQGVVLHSPQGVVLQVNAAAGAMLGVEPATATGVALRDLPVRWLAEGGLELPVASVFAARQGQIPGSVAGDLVVGVAQASGSAVRWVRTATLTMVSDGGPVELVTTLADVTEERRLAHALERSDARVAAALASSPIGVARADVHWRLLEVNAAFAALVGTTPTGLVGRELAALVHPDDRPALLAAVQHVLEGRGDTFTLEVRSLRIDGQAVWTLLDVVLLRGADEAPDHFLVHARDSTESRLRAETVAHRAVHDPLTGLANRAALQEAIESALTQPDAVGRVAVMVVDLDDFKELNDRFGHPAGDEVLVHVAGVLRAACGGRGIAARLGGDEFALVLQAPDAARLVFDLAAKIHRGLQEPVRGQRRLVPVQASLGAAVADETLLAGGPMALLAAADAALMQAKASGRGRTEVFHPGMRVPQESRHGAVAELGHAIDDGQLVLHFQPVVELATGAVCGHEVLVRWQHPDRGLLLPGDFLATAQEGGLGVALGVDVIRRVVAELAGPASGGSWLSVNLSADQLGDGDIAEHAKAELAAHGVDPARLVIELSETGLDTGSRIRQELADLHAIGVPVLLDAFGTGVSPLASLRDLPVAGVKLDMSITAGIPADPAAARVSQALAALAREMGMATFAEGIETAEQASFLATAGWTFGQGFFFGPARPELDAG